MAYATENLNRKSRDPIYKVDEITSENENIDSFSTFSSISELKIINITPTYGEYHVLQFELNRLSTVYREPKKIFDCPSTIPNIGVDDIADSQNEYAAQHNLDTTNNLQRRYTIQSNYNEIEADSQHFEAVQNNPSNSHAGQNDTVISSAHPMNSNYNNAFSSFDIDMVCEAFIEDLDQIDTHTLLTM